MKSALRRRLRWLWSSPWVVLVLITVLTAFPAIAPLGNQTVSDSTDAAPASAQPSQANPPPVQTWTLDELRERQTIVDDYRQQVSQQKEQLQIMEGEAVNRLGGIQRSLEQTSSDLTSNEAKLAEANVALQKIQTELTAVEGKYNQRRDTTVNRLRFLQKSSRTHNWSTLLQSDSLEDLLDRRYNLKRLYDADRQNLETLKQDADRVNGQKVAIESQKNQIALLLQQLSIQKSEFEAKAKAQRDLVLRLNTDRRALDAAAAQLSRDSKSLSVLIQQRVALRSYNRGTAFTPGTGQMILPTTGSITSPFGWRTHPVLGSRRFHAG
ncbi:MAG: hypothetical protein AAGB01_06910, partial [Cyanobacteria bacterium P01_F01_bin.42]